MTWKSTTVVSGVGLLATWLAAVPPTLPNASSGTQPSGTVRAAETVSDIEQQAARLQVRLRPGEGYQVPGRDPFRFAAAQRPSRAISATSTGGAVTPEPVVPSAPPPIEIRLSGIATDKVDEKDQRTAILSTPNGLVLAHEGDEVEQFRVGTIGEEAVDLIRVRDGFVLRISLRP